MLDLIIKNGQCYIDGELKDVDVAVKDDSILMLINITVSYTHLTLPTKA